MPNIKSSVKDLKRSRGRAMRNAAVRSGVKTAVKKARQAVAGSDAEGAQTATRAAARLLDKAATKGTIHKRAAARSKSRLARSLAATHTRAEPEPAPGQPESEGLGSQDAEQAEENGRD